MCLKFQLEHILLALFVILDIYIRGARPGVGVLVPPSLREDVLAPKIDDLDPLVIAPVVVVDINTYFHEHENIFSNELT